MNNSPNNFVILNDFNKLFPTFITYFYKFYGNYFLVSFTTNEMKSLQCYSDNKKQNI